MSDTVYARRDGAIATLHLNRLAKRNALTLEMWRRLMALVEEADRDTAVKVIVVTGEGDTFAAGADIDEFEQTFSDPKVAEQVAEITPKAAKVANHKEAWKEVATAVDPEAYPMELLLRCMEPKVSSEVTLTSFECTQDTIVLRGRAKEISPALKYSEDLKQTESLAFTWEPGSTPRIEADNSATFELKGTRRP